MFRNRKGIHRNSIKDKSGISNNQICIVSSAIMENMCSYKLHNKNHSVYGKMG